MPSTASLRSPRSSPARRTSTSSTASIARCVNRRGVRASRTSRWSGCTRAWTSSACGASPSWTARSIAARCRSSTFSATTPWCGKYTLIAAYPSKWELPELDAGGSNTAVEKITLSVENVIQEL
ncbi:MAG: phage tail protein [Deltaproteobacteria bacterium]|nr:phage tail protein [Deltaproteobacteria bacterium]